MLGPEASLGQPVAAQHVSLLCHGEVAIIARLAHGTSSVQGSRQAPNAKLEGFSAQ